jgi:hypothetical protein
MPPLLSGEAWVLRADVVATVLDEGALLLDLETKYFFQLNSPGWAVTQLFETPTTIEQAVSRARIWGAPAEDEASVTELITSLVSYGLVEPGTPKEGPMGEAPSAWRKPTLERHPEPLQRVIVSAFDPSIPLAE